MALAINQIGQFLQARVVIHNALFLRVTRLAKRMPVAGKPHHGRVMKISRP
jgi:hypothetical protein